MQLEKIERKISQSWSLPSHVAGIAVDISEIGGEVDAERLYQLQQLFLNQVRRRGYWNSLVSDRMEYVIRLSSHESELEFEEMYKLLCLMVEIEVLMKLGLPCDQPMSEPMRNALFCRFDRQPSVARAAAETVVKPWPWARDCWWLQEAARDS